MPEQQAGEHAGHVAESSWDFFVSYTRKDRAWAEWIAWELEQAGYRVLLQAWDFVPGSHWMTKMQSGMARSERTIAVLSSAYATSKYGTAEWMSAYKADPSGFNRSLIPIRIENCRRPKLLDLVVSFDLFGLSEEKARERLLAEVEAARRGAARPDNPPEFPGTYTPRDVDVTDLPPPVRPATLPRRPAFPGGRKLRPAILPLVAVAAVLGILTWWNPGADESGVTPRRPPSAETPAVAPTLGSGASPTPGIAPGGTPPATEEPFGISYDVKAGYSLVIRPGGYVTQQFVAATTTLTWAGAIAGCDPGLSFDCGPDSTSFGQLDIQVLDSESVIAEAAVRTTTNNATSGEKLEPPAHNLDIGRKYTMRVVNSTGKPVGFYFNRDSDPELETVVSGAYHAGDNGRNSSDLSALIDNRDVGP